MVQHLPADRLNPKEESTNVRGSTFKAIRVRVTVAPYPQWEQTIGLHLFVKALQNMDNSRQ